MYTIIADCEISRRKTLSHVLDHQSQLAFSAKSTAMCILWLIGKGEHEALMQTETKEIALRFAPLPN